MKKLRKIRWRNKLNRKLFGWNSISLPTVSTEYVVTPYSSVTAKPMDFPPETLFHLIFTDEEPRVVGIIDYMINNHMERVARDIVSGFKL
jgi:hypothetical protein